MNTPTVLAALCVAAVVFVSVRSLIRNRGKACAACKSCGCGCCGGHKPTGKSGKA